MTSFQALSIVCGYLIIGFLYGRLSWHAWKRLDRRSWPAILLFPLSSRDETEFGRFHTSFLDPEPKTIIGISTGSAESGWVYAVLMSNFWPPVVACNIIFLPMRGVLELVSLFRRRRDRLDVIPLAQARYRNRA